MVVLTARGSRETIQIVSKRVTYLIYNNNFLGRKGGESYFVMGTKTVLEKVTMSFREKIITFFSF
jgi:hypothetical protein